jgi:signal peptidase I
VLQPLAGRPGEHEALADNARFAALERTADTRRRLRRSLRIAWQLCAIAALITLSFFRIPQVDGRSMLPSITDGSHVLIDTLSYGLRLGPIVVGARPIMRGDVVAFRTPAGDGHILLKRVVALPGDTIALVNGTTFVNGRPFVPAPGIIGDTSNLRPQTVPPGRLFVLGDDRPDSVDSRAFGPVSEAAIVGKALFVIWPLSCAHPIH